MKPLLFRNLIPENESFHVQEDILAHFYDFLHYHPELQLTLIIKSSGTAFVGDNIGEFREGDIYLLGSNLPHVFRNNPAFYENTQSLNVHTLSLYFRPNSLGAEFFKLPETHAINEVMQKTARGIKFKGALKEQLRKDIIEIQHKVGFDKLMHFLSMLNTMTKSSEYELLSSVSFQKIKEDGENRRIQNVFDFVMSNYSREISLEEVSDLSSMSVTSFCRFFKQRTNKTFTQFLNEVRIGHACNELIYSDYNINEIAYRCGYNNISNFNRQFKEITKLTPSEYSKKAG